MDLSIRVLCKPAISSLRFAFALLFMYFTVTEYITYVPSELIHVEHDLFGDNEYNTAIYKPILASLMFLSYFVVIRSKRFQYATFLRNNWLEHIIQVLIVLVHVICVIIALYGTAGQSIYSGIVSIDKLIFLLLSHLLLSVLYFYSVMKIGRTA